MTEGVSVINLGELSKPATVLIKKISNGVGVLFEPTKIRRVAQAKADAALIEVKNQIKISDLQNRAVQP